MLIPSEFLLYSTQCFVNLTSKGGGTENENFKYFGFFLSWRYIRSLTKDKKEKLGILEAETLQLFLLFSFVKWCTKNSAQSACAALFRPLVYQEAL